MVILKHQHLPLLTSNNMSLVRKRVNTSKTLKQKSMGSFVFNCVPLDSVELLAAPQPLAKSRHSRAVETNDAWSRERGQGPCSAHLS